MKFKNIIQSFFNIIKLKKEVKKSMATVVVKSKKDGKVIEFIDSRYSFYQGFIYIWGTGKNKDEKKGRFRSKGLDNGSWQFSGQLIAKLWLENWELSTQK